MANKDYNKIIITDIKYCIDNLDIDRLWELALTDPSAVFNKISARQLGKRRLVILKAYLYAFDVNKLNENHSFEMLLLSCIKQKLKK